MTSLIGQTTRGLIPARNTSQPDLRPGSRVTLLGTAVLASHA
ncbi:hypothetical protein [Nocardia sp. NPDC006630]